MNSNLFFQFFNEIKENPTKLKRKLLSRLDFSKIYEAPRPMPKEYSEGLPRFFANSIESIESHLDVFWCYMESLGAEHEDVYMRALGESLGGNADFWLYTLAPRSITGYDMFTDLLREEWGKNIDKSIHPNNDCVVEDQADKDDQDNHNKITDNFSYPIDSSSLDLALSVLLNNPLTRENDDEQVSTL